MKKTLGPVVSGFCAIAILAAALAPPARAQSLPEAKLAKILGQTPETTPDNVLRFTWLRTDLRVRVDRVEVEPALVVKSWAAFESSGASGSALVTGELAVTAGESQHAIDALQTENFNVTGVGDQLIGETPRLAYIDFTGGGMPLDLAASLMKVLRKTATPLGQHGVRHLLHATENEPNWAGAITAALGRKPVWRNRVLTFRIARNNEIRIGLIVVTPSMGTEETLNFQRAGDLVASAGQLVLIDDEVNPVVALLRRHGFTVTALYDHLLSESPRLFFVHYWVVGKPKEIASTLADAMNRINVTAPK